MLERTPNCGEVTRQRKGGFGFLVVVSYGKTTRKCLVYKGYLVRFALQVSVIVFFLVQERGIPLQMEIYFTFTKRNLCPAFRQKGRGQRVPLVSDVS